MSTISNTSLDVLKPADFASDQDVRWCPGCGDYSILAQVKKILPKLGIPRERYVFVSGIGCSSRFPYYMNTYGFHSIHGRAPGFATGLKVVRPDLSVWVVTGDGDGLSIGGNHLLHAIRRNLDINILLFNNRIYGLTKGQYSPTSELGKNTKSSPMGSIDNPIRPLSIAIGAEASFVARTLDVDVSHLAATLERAARHQGTSFVEIYQDCNVFNHGAFEYAADKNQRPDNVLYLEHGKPMIFGRNRDKGIRLHGMNLEVVTLGNGITEDDLLFHDEKSDNSTLAFLLSQMRYPEFPEPMGVLRCVDKPRYEVLAHQQVDKARAKGEGRLEDLFGEGDTWTAN
ncbi:MAG: 2-oxoglutarate ferredoxin oxidoreductase subunit beta [Phycisphaerae bacterium]